MHTARPPLVGVRLILGAAMALASISCTYLPLAFAPAPDVTLSESRDAVVLVPAAGSPGSTGLMVYPGALVDPHAYVPWLSELAAGGIPVVIVREPGNLAVLSIDAGIPLRSLVPSATAWVLAGHSLGGAMAAWSVARHRDTWAGLVLLAAYPSASESLAAWNRPVLSLSASADGLATPQKVTDARSLLPAVSYDVDAPGQYSATPGGYAVYHQVQGGNHAGFGSYGPQEGDGAATISAEAQHAELVAYITEFFSVNGW
jgi:hypothetical protein